MKLMLKRQSGNEWNVESSADNMEVLPDRPAHLSGKLDKVVLNLKKSVTGNTWNVSDKNQSQVGEANQASAQAVPSLPVMSSSAPQDSPASNVPRRGRKSKVAPMKIQNVHELTKEQDNR